jgi:hypothetical protein
MAAASFAQTVETFYVNDGRNDLRDAPLGEFAPDLGGALSWERYSDNAPGTGHYFARRWVNSTLSFRDAMYDGILDLGYLNSLTSNPANCNPPIIILPFSSSQVPLESGVTSVPITNVAWWNPIPGGTPGTSPRQVLYWPYKINGGSMMICMAGDGNGNPARPVGAGPASILLYNYATHFSDFGTNKNRWHYIVDEDRTREFSPSEPLRPPPAQPDIFFAEGGWPGGATPILGPKEQALEAGDIVVFVQENYSMSAWISLQRTQEAEYYTRNQFAPAPPHTGFASFPAIPVGRSYVHGGSHGKIVSTILSLLQPKIYGGSAEWLLDDVGFGLQDQFELQNHFGAAMGRIPWTQTTDSIWSAYYNAIDLLGIRFDSPRFGRQPWDVGAFSFNRRPTDLSVPVYGGVGDAEFNFPMHWPLADTTLSSNLHVKFYKNRAHEEFWGYVPGVNEFSFYTGNEWATLKGSGVPAPQNSKLVPTTSPGTKPIYADPYSHTLRHVHVTPPGNPNLLAEIDIQNGMTPTYKKPLPGLNWIGQGTWPGYHDSLHVLDLDGDGKLEVVFGNLDGYVHILEFSQTDPNDPFKLYDEWKSPYLGRGLFSSDNYMVGGLGRMVFANSLGQLYRIECSGPDSYVVANGGAPIAVPSTTNNYLYQGATPFVLVNDFYNNNSNKEILVMNRFFDWALFDAASGSPITSGRLERGPTQNGTAPTSTTRLLAATDVFPANTNTADTDKEALVAAADGNLWQLDFKNSTGNWAQTSQALPFTNLVLWHVVPCFFSGGTTPTHVLLFGTNSDLNDAIPSAVVGRVELWDLATQTRVASTPVIQNDDFNEAMSFAWIQRPATGTGDFVIAGANTIQRYQLTLGPPGSIASVTSRPVFPINKVNAPNADAIISLDTALLSNGAGSGSTYVVFSTSSGRIFVLDQNLNFMRDSMREAFPSSPPGTPVPWPSNRTLGQTYACDASSMPGGGVNGTGILYFAEYANPYWNNVHYRIGSVIFGTSSNTWNPFVTEAKNGDAWDVLFPTFNRTLLYRDLDGDGTPEARVYAETGTAFLDGRMSPPRVREFQTASYQASFYGNWLTSAPSPFRAQGGRVFERPVPHSTDYWYLGGFTIPPDPTIPYASSGTGYGSGWWYPTVGTNFLTGQIGNHTQSVFQLGLGTSMRKAEIRQNSSAPTTTPHIIVGTNGGYVYGIEPGTNNSPANGNQVSTLRLASPDLGSFIIGLDVGNLDADIDDEVVCGSWIDTGTYVDWLNGTVAKNRAHLYILDPVPGGPFNNFNVQALDADNPPGSGNGIGSGVTGVRIDDVNADGVKEIWCSDAIGHLYLFSHKAGPWTCVYKSADLCAYPGSYNNIFPIKNSGAPTTKLAVVAPGYVIEFSVNPLLIP